MSTLIRDRTSYTSEDRRRFRNVVSLKIRIQITLSCCIPGDIRIVSGNSQFNSISQTNAVLSSEDPLMLRVVFEFAKDPRMIFPKNPLP